MVAPSTSPEASIERLRQIPLLTTPSADFESLSRDAFMASGQPSSPVILKLDGVSYTQQSLITEIKNMTRSVKLMQPMLDVGVAVRLDQPREAKAA